MAIYELITMRIECEILDHIRKQAERDYRTIAKQINYLLKKQIESEIKK